MGREIGTTEYTRSQRTRYRRELRRNLDLFETFLDTAGVRPTRGPWASSSR
jgi:hypothetical protein